MLVRLYDWLGKALPFVLIWGIAIPDTLQVLEVLALSLSCEPIQPTNLILRQKGVANASK